jgi:hypothetical protein
MRALQVPSHWRHIPADRCHCTAPQVLLTHEAWVELRKNMAGAGFPVVTLVGEYKFSAVAYLDWMYQAVAVIGRPLGRGFGELRRGVKTFPKWVQLRSPGSWLHTMPHPLMARAAASVKAPSNTCECVMHAFSGTCGRDASHICDPALTVPRRLYKMPPIWSLQIIAPVLVQRGTVLSFVACRLTSFPHGVNTVPLSVQRKLEEVLMVSVGAWRSALVHLLSVS